MLIDGKKIAEEVLSSIEQEVKTLDLQPRLAAVLVGNHPGSARFLELKEKAAKKIGIAFRLYKFPSEITTQQLSEEIIKIINDDSNSSVLVELPLPSHINAQDILNLIPEGKDVDVLSEKAQGLFFAGRSLVLPPAVEAVKIILEKNNVNLESKDCAVFGQGILVGKPISSWLTQNKAQVLNIDEFTANPAEISKKAEIVISGVGKPKIIKSDMIKEGAIVIDFGYENSEGRISGDVDFDEVNSKTSLITPVPGGVGPVVIAAVLKNLIQLIKQK